MFWGLVVDAGKRYHQTVERSFHVSMAALDLSDDNTAVVQLMLTSENKNYLLCTLNKQHPQYQLDLNFVSGESIAFSCNGNGCIHLTGYLVPEDDDPSDSSDDDEEEEEEIPEFVTVENLKRKKSQQKAIEGPQKKKKKVFEQTQESESDDDDSEQYEDVEEEEEPQANGKMEVEKKKKKKKKNKNKQNDSLNESKTPTKVEKNKNTEKDAAKQKNKNQEKPATPLKKTIEGGVIIEDLKVGSGSVAKPGKMLQVFYEGRLKSNNKVFDSAKEGRGFTFRLGRQEVIKGWDVAVNGMRVGGKRKVICPPNMAYGAKGSPPVIPANSTLVFEIELKNVK